MSRQRGLEDPHPRPAPREPPGTPGTPTPRRAPGSLNGRAQTHAGSHRCSLPSSQVLQSPKATAAGAERPGRPPARSSAPRFRPAPAGASRPAAPRGLRLPLPLGALRLRALPPRAAGASDTACGGEAGSRLGLRRLTDSARHSNCGGAGRRARAGAEQAPRTRGSLGSGQRAARGSLRRTRPRSARAALLPAPLTRIYRQRRRHLGGALRGLSPRAGPSRGEAVRAAPERKAARGQGTFPHLPPGEARAARAAARAPVGPARCVLGLVVAAVRRERGALPGGARLD